MAAPDKNSKALQEKKGIATPDILSSKAAKAIQEKRSKTPSVETLTKGILLGNVTSLSQAITIIESTAKKHRDTAEEIISSWRGEELLY